jgi:LPS-assembly lipoprotein
MSPIAKQRPSFKNGRAVVLASALFLGACGFRPVYGTHGLDSGSPVAAELNTIAIENIPDRDGQILRNNLIDRLYGPNRPAKLAYALTVKVHFSEQDLGILANATATRSLLDMYADYTLTDKIAGKEILKGTAHSVAGFDRLDAMYGTVAARNDAHQRTLHEISEQIVARISVYFSERK